MSETIGADKLIQITGQYGIITDSTISNYNGIDNDWNWVSKVDTATANDYNEIEILGTDGNYYIHITSWDNEEDIVEAEIINKITLSNNATGDDGARSSFSWPSTWTTLLSDGDDGVSPDVEILTVKYATDEDHIFFQIETEADADLSDSTFGILINDVSNTAQTNEAVCHTRQTGGGTNLAYISTWSGGGYYGNSNMGSSHLRINNGDFSGIELACDISLFGFSYTDGDSFAAVSGDSGNNEFMDDWMEINTPTGVAGMDDLTAYSAIPEFSTIMMPVASVLLIVGNRLRNKKTSQH
jgi:hypothetical protein